MKNLVQGSVSDDASDQINENYEWIKRKILISHLFRIILKHGCVKNTHRP